MSRIERCLVDSEIRKYWCRDGVYIAEKVGELRMLPVAGGGLPMVTPLTGEKYVSIIHPMFHDFAIGSHSRLGKRCFTHSKKRKDS
jgi:hypothetical protein